MRGRYTKAEIKEIDAYAKARLGGLFRRVRTCRERLEAYLAGTLVKIEELEEEVLPYAYDALYSNNHSALIRRSIT